MTDFLLAGRMANTETQWKRRVLLLASLGINLGLLCYFKYTNFFYQILAPLWNGKFQPLDIFLAGGNIVLHFPVFKLYHRCLPS